MSDSNFVLTLQCPNRPGIVAAILSRLAEHGGDITEAAQFDDSLTNRFFMRVAFRLLDGKPIEPFRAAAEDVAAQHDMALTLDVARRPMRVLLMVSKFDHCLGDLLYRMRIGELPMLAVGVVSNHAREALRVTVEDDIPFHHLPVTAATKAAQEAEVRRLIEATGAELVVLARYMQVLSDEMSAYLAGRCINIHHSFLPGFKGAKPYHQAHARGVKMIGATAHYVTGDLDEGPIIAQDVEHVSHADTPDDLVRKGRDIERRVLARAVADHLDHRVLISGAKTVVFRR